MSVPQQAEFSAELSCTEANWEELPGTISPPNWWECRLRFSTADNVRFPLLVWFGHRPGWHRCANDTRNILASLTQSLEWVSHSSLTCFNVLKPSCIGCGKPANDWLSSGSVNPMNLLRVTSKNWSISFWRTFGVHGKRSMFLIGMTGLYWASFWPVNMRSKN